MPKPRPAAAPAAAAPSPTDGAARRMPAEDTVDVAFEWKGVPWKATMLLDVTAGEIDALFEPSVGPFKAALGALVTAWDFVDRAGEPIPLPRDGGVSACPYPLLRRLASAYIDALAAPKA